MRNQKKKKERKKKEKKKKRKKETQHTFNEISYDQLRKNQEVE